ncbi:hypothetical protein A8C32_17680 [Flavivirga aquatica]|uniref:Membrane-binding protein n=2 Tax=Flavivirga aquatica TaxID=1849968 RepID=A0A1E5T8J2_9FLAO|nr:hypothetical protein A8C32_17680 [Flavivirga aquatica]
MIIEEVELIEEVKFLDVVTLNESLRDIFEYNLVLSVSEEGLYKYVKDSTLYNGSFYMTLHDNFDSDTGEIPYGFLSGKIEDGKKEGNWEKGILTNKGAVIVKLINYSNGVLHGKYQVFDLKGNVLTPNEVHPLFPEEYKDYTDFKNGTGEYYDYYYDTGILKEKGYYRNGKKYYTWIVYDRQGNEIKREYYNNGFIVNE